MAPTIVDYYIGWRRSVGDRHWEYDVNIDGEQIVTTVTRNKRAVAAWIRSAYNHHKNLNNGNHLVVCFDAKGRRLWKRPFGTIQLFVGRRCLVYQIFRVRRSAVLLALVNFLRDKNNVFVGVHVLPNMLKLRRDYSIPGTNTYTDLGRAAAEWYGERDLRDAGLKRLAWVVMRRNFVRVRWPWVRNKWDAVRLSRMQVMYATFHAYLSYEIGWSLCYAER